MHGQRQLVITDFHHQRYLPKTVVSFGQRRIRNDYGPKTERQQHDSAERFGAKEPLENR
jgi:hypothetical protein